jgi:GNAT superfamily N-acetyltransferase
VIERTCPLGDSAPIVADDIDAFTETFFSHVKREHVDLPYPDEAVRNFGAGLARMTGSTERLDEIGTIEVHAVTADRVDDWLQLFDHDVFAGFPQWSACYCTEPHLYTGEEGSNRGTWRDKRATMIERFASGTVQGYLAYVDGRPAGWVNASTRDEYALFRRNDDEDVCTIGVSCFAIAPPYRGHGVSKALLDRVVADAASRDAHWIEAYPFNDGRGNDNPDFRGPRQLYDERGFTEVHVRARDTVVRRPV